MMMMKRLLTLAAAVAFAAPAAAQEQLGPNLIDPRGWTLWGAGGGGTIPNGFGLYAGYSYSQSDRVYYGSGSELWQTIGTSLNTGYFLSFLVRYRSFGPFGAGDFRVSFGGQPVTFTTVKLEPCDADYGCNGVLRQATAWIATPTTSSTLRFENALSGVCRSELCGENESIVELGDISLRAIAAPEPATFALVAGGLALVGVAGRRRKAHHRLR